MQDQIRFTTKRRDNQVAVVCVGHDGAGHPVEFELRPATFRANSLHQIDWATRAEQANDIMQAYLKIGVDPDRAWLMAEPALPADLLIGTGWGSAADGVADLGDQRLERLDDRRRDPGDEDH